MSECACVCVCTRLTSPKIRLPTGPPSTHHGLGHRIPWLKVVLGLRSRVPDQEVGIGASGCITSKQLIVGIRSFWLRASTALVRFRVRKKQPQDSNSTGTVHKSATQSNDHSGPPAHDAEPPLAASQTLTKSHSDS